MKRSAAATALGLALGMSGAARAGVYTDELSKCLVTSTSSGDQIGFMVWAFTAMSAHPAVKAYSSVTDAQRETATRQAAQLMERLVTADCRKQTVAALKFEGNSAIEQAFSVLGQVAMRGLISDPAVTRNMASLPKYLDLQKFAALAKDVAPAPGAAPKP